MHKELQDRGIDPDVVVHVDPTDLKKLKVNKDGNKLVIGTHGWVMKTSVIFLLSCINYSAKSFEAPFKNILWMSPGLPIGELLPIKTRNFERVGGSVSHSALI